MGGEAGAESEPGRGSTFWFTVWLDRGHGIQPLKSSTETQDAETELSKYYSGSKILLVEDNAINREVAYELLNVMDLAVDTAENGLEAVEKVRVTDYDLILMDVQMPLMDGLEATRLIRSMTGKADLPILAMTANIFEDDRQACTNAGMNAFVAKPFDMEVLFSTIIQYLPKPATLVETTPTLSSSQQSADVTTPATEQEVIPINPETLSRLLGDDTSKHLNILKKFGLWNKLLKKLQPWQIDYPIKESMVWPKPNSICAFSGSKRQGYLNPSR